LKPKENINNPKPLFQINFDERIKKLKKKEKITEDNNYNNNNNNQKNFGVSDKFRLSHHIEKMIENDVSYYENNNNNNKWKSNNPVNNNSIYNLLLSTNDFYKGKLLNELDRDSINNNNNNNNQQDSNSPNNYSNKFNDPNITYFKQNNFENILIRNEHHKRNQSMNNINNLNNKIDFHFPFQNSNEYINPIFSNRISFNNFPTTVKKIQEKSNFKGFKNISLGKKYEKKKVKRINIQNLTKAVKVSDTPIRKHKIIKDKEPIFKNNYINNSVKNEKKPFLENALDYNQLAGRMYPMGDRSMFHNNKIAYRLSNSTRNLSEFFENFNDRY